MSMMYLNEKRYNYDKKGMMMMSENLERLIKIFKKELCTPVTEALIDVAEYELAELKEKAWMYDELTK